MKIVIRLHFKKEYILYFSLFFILFVSFLALVTYLNSTATISLNYPDNLKEEYNIYKEEINKYKASKCRGFVKSFMDEIDVGMLDDEFDIDTAYAFIPILDVMSNYKTGNESCKIDEVTKKTIANLYLNIMSNRDAVIRPYFFQYEIGFKDHINDEVSPAMSNISYTALKNSEMALLRIYMNTLREENKK